MEDNSGTKCQDDSECWGEICAEEICSGQRNNGEICKIDRECVSGSCKNGICLTTGDNQNCSPGGDEQQCNKGKFCASSTSTCIPHIQPGKECIAYLKPNFTDYEYACTPGYICNPDDSDFESGKCVALFSLEEGSSCGINSACEYGLGCYDGKCKEEVEKCDLIYENQCPFSSYCKCESNGDYGTCVEIANSDCSDELIDFQMCLENYQCNLVHEFLPGTCAHTNCFGERRAVECCQQEDYESKFFPHRKINCGENLCLVEEFAGPGKSCADEDTSCETGLFCKPEDGDKICTKDNTGSECSSNDECYYNLCVDSVCSGLRGPGETCDHNDQCNTKTCESNVCKGIAEGESCEPHSGSRVCDTGLFCDSENTQTCIKQIQTNGDCTEYINDPNVDYVCTSMHTCDVTGNTPNQVGKCRGFNKAILDQECGSTSICRSPLVCKNEKCVTMSSCNDNNDNQCPLNYKCECDSEYYGECEQIAQNTCILKYDDYFACMVNNKCDNDENFVEGSCKYSNCKDEFSSLECCRQQEYEDTYYISNLIECNPTPTPSTTPTPTSTSTPTPTKTGSATPTSSTSNSTKNNNSSLALGLGLGLGLPIFFLIVGVVLFIALKKKKETQSQTIIESLLDQEEDDEDEDEGEDKDQYSSVSSDDDEKL